VERLRSKAVEGLTYGLAGRVLLITLQTVTSLATARYLSPQDFGIVALALIYINFLSQFSDFGITSAVVQKGDLDQKTLQTAFTLKAGMGLCLCCAGIAVGAMLAVSWDNSSGLIICVLSTNFLWSTFSFLPQTKLTVDLEYRALFRVSVTVAVVSASVTLLLLAHGFRYWAVAIANVCSVLVAAAQFNFIRPSTLRISWSHTRGISLIKFGRPIFMTGIVNFLVLYGGNFIIGTTLGAEALGFYSLAFAFSFMLVNQVGSIIVSTLFPIYSTIKSDTAQLRSMFMSSVAYTAAIAFLVNIGLVCVSKPFFFLILGDGSAKWFPALATFQILCMNGILAALLYPIAPLTVAIGKPHLQLRAVALAGVVQLVSILPALRFAGIEGVAYVLTLGWVAQYIVYLPMLKKQFDLTLSELVATLAPALIAGMSMLVLARCIEIALPNGDTYRLETLFAQCLALGASFVVVHGVLTRWQMATALWRLSRRGFRNTRG